MRLMIVDDDDQIRTGMANGINWSELGIDEVESCKNGAEALKRMMEQTFDILVTDISMPEMNGVELMRHIKRYDPDIHVILISGYREFEYAEAGIRYGADSYILKPIHINEFMDAVTQVLGKIDSSRKVQKNELMAKELRRNQMMNKIMEDKLDDCGELKEFLLTECGFEKIHTLLGVVFSDDSSTYRLEAVKEELVKKAAEYLAGYTYTFFSVSGNESFLLIDVIDSTLLVFRLKQQIRRMSDSVNKAIDGSISAGGSGQGTLKDAARLYQNAKHALEFGFFYGRGACLFYQDCLEAENKIESQAGLFPKEVLMQALEEGSEEKIGELVDSCKEKLFGCKKEQLQRIILESMLEISRTNTKEVSEEKLRQAVFDAESFLDMMEFWKAYMLHMRKRREDEEKYSREICEALEYIRGHYGERITVEELAERLEISTGHFSRTFKQQVGISFVKYLNQYRMDKAEELLKNTNLKVYEIAEQVGITDYMYFTQVFRSIKGKTPKDIRKSN